MVYAYVHTCVLKLFNRAARSPQGPGTKSTMGKWNRESRSTTNGRETSDIDKRKIGHRSKANGQVANEHRSPKPEETPKGTHEPKSGPKKAEHGTTRGQKWSQEGPKRVQKRSQTASRTKKRIKTTLRPSWDPPRGRAAALSVTPMGAKSIYFRRILMIFKNVP